MKILKDSQGLALFTVMFAMTVLLLFLSARLFLSRIDTKITANLKLANQALEAADAGLQHALTVIETGYDFDGDLAPCDPLPFPCPVWDGEAYISNIAFGSGFAYTVTASNDPVDLSNGGTPTDDTNNLVVLTSTSSGPNGTKRVVQGYVGRSSVGFTPPGAVYVPAESVTVTFPAGTGFFITGDDTDYDGSPPPTPKPAIPGVATIPDPQGGNSLEDSFKTALGSTRYNLVQGSGYSAGPPETPSVITTSQVFDVSQMAQNFQNNANAVYLDGLVYTSTACPSSSPCTLGTDSSPQITYIKEGLNHIHFDGHVTGSGVLVVEGDTHIYGDFTFHGLVINIQPVSSGEGFGFPDDPEPFSLKGNAKIFGGLLIGPTNGAQRFYMEGNTGIYYSSKALTMANGLCGSCLPQPARISAWLDK